MLFRDRKEAGRLLASELAPYKNQNNVIVLGLARGGVVVAYEVAKELSLPLNVVTPRKIGAPGNPELALGSIMENGEGVFNHAIIRLLGVSQTYINHEIEKEKGRAQQRLTLYRQYAPLPDIKDHTVILVDDGIATGSTMLASVKAMRQAGAKSVIVAVPVSSTEAYRLVEEVADQVVCPYVREDFIGVGMFYRFFPQTEDEEVIQLLKDI
jgi:putative phosphoribosyl transferase